MPWVVPTEMTSGRWFFYAMAYDYVDHAESEVSRTCKTCSTKQPAFYGSRVGAAVGEHVVVGVAD